MKLTIDSGKYRKKVLPFWFVSAVFVAIPIMIVVMNINLNQKLNMERVTAIALSLLLLVLPVSFARFFYKLKRREYVMALDNGVLINYGKPFVKPIFLPIEHVESIASWGSGDKVNQYKIIVKGGNSRGALIDQLNRKHIYITDFVVDSDEFHKLAQMIQNLL